MGAEEECFFQRLVFVDDDYGGVEDFLRNARTGLEVIRLELRIELRRRQRVRQHTHGSEFRPYEQDAAILVIDVLDTRDVDVDAGLGGAGDPSPKFGMHGRKPNQRIQTRKNNLIGCVGRQHVVETRIQPFCDQVRRRFVA